MASRGSKSALQARTETERARLHAARSAWHSGQVSRRVRDNTIAGVVGGLIVAAAITSQFLNPQVTAPEPTPTPIETPVSEITPSETPTG